MEGSGINWKRLHDTFDPIMNHLVEFRSVRSEYISRHDSDCRPTSIAYLVRGLRFSPLEYSRLTPYLTCDYRCGDFFQLPPVPDRHDRTSVFAFQARTWNKCITKIFTLTQVFRQKAGSKIFEFHPLRWYPTDHPCLKGFVQMLNEARTGVLSPSSIRKFAMLDRPIVYTDGIDATELVYLSFAMCTLEEQLTAISPYSTLSSDRLRMRISVDCKRFPVRSPCMSQ